MPFETGPSIYLDELPEDVATVIFGADVVKKFYRKPYNKPFGSWEIVGVDRDTKTVTVTFSQDK